MRKYLLLLSVLIACLLSVSAQQPFRTKIFNANIKTLQVELANTKLSLPIMELNSQDLIQIGFDEMSHGNHSYSYKVIHCNADWTPSGLNSNEFLSGFSSGNITDYHQSLNTTYLYTHYAFQVPNSEMRFKLSGNYVVTIYEDNNTDNPIAHACFSIVESKVNITGTIRGNTDTELSGRKQQLDFEVLINGYQVRDASSEIKVVVRQNNRIDNQLTDLQPTYLSNSKLSFINNKALIFDGGNEYHHFDISSVYAAGEGVANVQFTKPYYDVTLYDNKIQKTRIYSTNPDANGKFVINVQNNQQNDDYEADYMFVHFNLPTPPFFDGQLYLGGEFNYNQMNDAVRLKYDNKAESYNQTVLLKQGGYNYQYWFVQKGEQKASPERVEGSFWQTNNDYTVYVYHRPWGERYDKLVGVKTISN